MMTISRRATLTGTALAAVLPAAARAASNPFDPTVTTAAHLEPAIPRPEQEAAARRKLAAMRARIGKAPNILVLLVDDMGWGDPGCYGGGGAIGAPTPNIDRLAASGVRYTSAYSQPTCTPSRAAMMTGRIPTRSGLTRPILSGEKPKVNPWSDEVTSARLLSAAGYRTALSGKWHLGEGPGLAPHEVGYDEYFGILSVISEMSQQVDKRLYPDLVLKPERVAAVKSIAPAHITKGRKGGVLEVDREITSIDELSRIDQLFADFSDDFIRRSAKAGQPFMLYHSFGRLHNDSYPAPGYEGRSPAGFPQRDALIEVDDIVGRLMKALADTGQLENTLVLFTSDNGANEDLFPDSSTTPFRGGKGTTWEGGVRVPFIASWPGMIPAGGSSDGIIDLCDCFNTLLGVAGITDRIAPQRYIDGIDQTSFLLAGSEGQSHRDAVFMYNMDTLMAVRWMEYKIHFRIFDVQAAGRNLDESTVQGVGLSPWVYNLWMDPKESRSQGHSRFEWGVPQVNARVKRHMATFVRFPRKDIGLGKSQANND